jgi:hypothetical protein
MSVKNLIYLAINLFQYPVTWWRGITHQRPA